MCFKSRSQVAIKKYFPKGNMLIDGVKVEVIYLRPCCAKFNFYKLLILNHSNLKNLIVFQPHSMTEVSEVESLKKFHGNPSGACPDDTPAEFSPTPQLQYYFFHSGILQF